VCVFIESWVAMSVPVVVAGSIARRSHYVLLTLALVLGGLSLTPVQAHAAAPSAAGAFVSLEPSRLLDTRVGTGASRAPVAAYSTVNLQVAGRGGVPIAGAAAVVVNVTVTSPASSGFITAYPSGTGQPTASNLNFTSGQSIPNLVTVKVGADGTINLTNNSPGSVQLIADVAGYYISGTATAPGTFVSLEPSRLLDTRVGTGAAAAPVAAYSTVGLQVTGGGNVPDVDVAAVVVNVTVTSPSSSGFITVYPLGSNQPTASNLNFTAGQTIPNLVTVKVSPDGMINLTNNSSGSVQLLADVAGYYLAGSATEPGAFVSVDPARLLDTRVGTGAPASPVAANATVFVQVTGRGVVPVAGVAAVVANVTVTAPTSGGFITAYASGTLMPAASNLNFSTGQSIPNLASVRVGADGRVALTNNSAGGVHLLADVAGYYLGDPAQPSGGAAALQLTHDLPTTSVGTASATLNSLTVAAPGTMDGYSRSQFGSSWLDATNNGWPAIPNSNCDVRQAALYREGTGVSYNSACDILSGSWLDAYTAVTLYAISDVDIDHVVPLAESWRTGAAGWTAQQRTKFAHDKLVVLAVDDGTNQSKGDKGPHLWKPPNQAAHCLYAKRWIVIKSTYTLTVNPSEKTALQQMLTTCQS